MELTYRSLEKNEDSVEEVEVPDSGANRQVEDSREERHEPLVGVLVWLDVLQLEMLAEFKEVELEDLFEDLEYSVEKVNE